VIVAGDVESVDEIKRGAGAIISHGLSKVAVYRDPQGQIHEMSAVCRHLGCIVNWNSLENTWDCPCHGSRYDAMGRVTQGPANSDLEPVSGEQ
jgi:Rieske Fe-S protein